MRHQPTQPHTNNRAMRPGTVDYDAVRRPLSDSQEERYNFSEQELHEHYASNALACGHTSECLKVALPVNWPTLWGRPLCTCGRGEPSSLFQSEIRI